MKKENKEREDVIRKNGSRKVEKWSMGTDSIGEEVEDEGDVRLR